MNAKQKLYNATQVILSDKRIKAWLQANDIKAYRQLEEAAVNFVKDNPGDFVLFKKPRGNCTR